MATEIDIINISQIIEVVERGPQGISPDLGLSLIPDNNMPMVVNSKLVDSKLRVTGDGTLIVGLNSIQYGQAHKAGSAGENIVTTNLSTGISYHPVWQTLGEGNTATVRIRSADLPPITISADTLDITNPSWTQGTISGNQTVRSSKLRFVQDQTNVRIAVALNNVEVFSTIIPQILAGDYTLNYLGNTLATPSGIDLKAGQILSLSILSEDGDVVVRGDNIAGELVPYQVGVIALWEDKQVALKEDTVEGDRAYTKSGYIGGSLPTISRVSPTTISIGGGTFNYEDLTDTLNIKHITKTLSPILTYTLTTLPAELIAYIYLDVSTMTIIESDTVPAVKVNDWVYLGNVDFDAGDIMTNSFIETAFSNSNTMNSLLFSRGDYNLDGNNYYGKGGLVLGHTAGLGIRVGGNTSVDVTDPDRVKTNLDSIAFVVRAHTDTSSNLVINIDPSTLDPTQYSKNGVLKSVSSNKWTIQYLYHFYGSDVVLVYYGTKTYSDSEKATAAIISPPIDIHKIRKEAAFRSAIVIRGGAVELSLTTDALIYNV